MMIEPGSVHSAPYTQVWCFGWGLGEKALPPRMVPEGSRKGPARIPEGSHKGPGKLPEEARKAPGKVPEGFRKGPGVLPKDPGWLPE
eukprot:8465219-Karenia_brevis.AAC.1